jgi:hypothetical protein
MLWRKPIAMMRAHDTSRTNSGKRDRVAIKREINQMAVELLAQNGCGASKAILAVCAWRTALSLAKELVHVNRLINSEIQWPTFASLRLVPIGLFQIWRGHDQLFERPSGEEPALVTISH